MQYYENWPYVSSNMIGPGPTNKNMGSGMPTPGIMQPDMNMDLQPGYTPHLMQQETMQPGMGLDMMQQEHIDVDMAEALELIRQQIKGEMQDRLFYQYLLDNVPTLLDKEIIEEVRDNEKKHAKIFRQLYFELTGKTIQPDENVSFEKPKTYCEGLRGALMGETSAIKKHRRILAAMKSRKHINMMVEIITDELRHGSLYNLLIHNNNCKY
ncbi:ferritin family protein [Ruminiclostridium cellulolyticum]|uniref:Rubrerythrin n=1 Tax=Ruminiclostridium cellulolyticum (strain ATCC 35319 / DSM 5812 / JCM 6584 / H10) TaxID=394503 RepID=B8I025_RUMCH|nr:ferritin-like domain-containing protein [Ruminiclostridium cellulolyticum]ACL75525.1 Rubrerythrin [Ruminiclostridium cellulolyticum H10]